MRTIVLLALGLGMSLAVATGILCEVNRVSRRVVVWDKRPAFAPGSEGESGLPLDAATDPSPPQSLQSDASRQDDTREPLYPSDDHLRQQMQEILHRAAERLDLVLEDRSPVELQDPAPTKDRHWSFQRLHPVAVPHASGVAHPVDAFIARRLALAGLQLGPSADPRALIRRLSYDLRGLPPEPQTVEAFVPRLADPEQREAAWTELVERYLADSAHGEHWARMWLDLARYADSNGYELDDLRPNAYPFRDFVIWALNVDLPYDVFVQWQIAGDEMQPDYAPAVCATGFLAAAPHNTFMPQPIERYDELHDMISTTGIAMLGLSVGCARCHDHFYDPISSVEYYRWVSILESVWRVEPYLAPGPDGRDYAEIAAPLVEREDRLYELLVRRIQADKIAKLDFSSEEKALLWQPMDPDNQRQQELLARCGGCLRADASDFAPDLQPLPEHAEEYARLTREITALKSNLPWAPPQVLSITGSEVYSSRVLHGGSLERPGQSVGPGFLSALTYPATDWQTADAWQKWLTAEDLQRGAGPRTAWARWLTDVNNGSGGLLARVIVNRIWHQYFGVGLVASVDDFGAQTDPPLHADLLEWLAGELVRNDWRLSHIHRLIVTSRTYQQTSRIDDQRREADANGSLFSHYRLKRLSAEMYRDSVLAVTDALNREMYGPSIYPPIPQDAIYTDDHELDSKWPTDVVEDPAVWRRSIYVALRRSNTVPLLSLLDGPDGSVCRGQRVSTTTAVQSLALLNAPFIETHAARLAEQLSEASLDLADQTHMAYRRVYQRGPTEAEESAIFAYIEQRRRDSSELYDVDVMTEICHALLISNEFLYID
ncbi:MAG: DUF1553 domain-containing protein [Planctomycetota bacterium]|nr:MAG: DUF1553 domain-containing protein [Planctomycetota bacterium]